jgi:hypothetical protein
MMGRKPCEMASTTVARTQPLVVQPVMSMVSIPCAVKIGAKGVPKNGDAYCLTMLRS